MRKSPDDRWGTDCVANFIAVIAILALLGLAASPYTGLIRF